jgi:hypothetical protein
MENNMRKILAVFSYAMDNSVRSEVYSTMEDFREARKKYLEIRVVVFAMWVNLSDLIQFDDKANT